CAVLAYVQDHFNCSPNETVNPDTPIPFPDIDLPLPDPGSNDHLPDDDDYDEDQRKPIWWYHTDHLGSSTYLTDNFGRPSHYYETLPFGEMMVEHNQSANVPSGVGYDNKWKFNGKELDDATQMYYYGARYYDPRISIFVSVDPLAEKYPNYGGYIYTLNNPIMFVDPDGRSPIRPDKIITTVSNSKVSNTRITRDISIKMTVTVVNMTGSNLSSTMFRGGKGNIKLDNFKGWGESYTSGARAVYGGVDSAKNNIKNFEVDFVVVKSLDDIRKGDNVLL